MYEKLYKEIEWTSIDSPRISDIWFENDRLLIEDTMIVIKSSEDNPFTWDGCTPKWKVLDIVIGTPDGVTSKRTGKPKTYYASMFHDALYKRGKKSGITRKQADLIFYDEMKKQRFKLAKLYYFAVRIMGVFYW